MSEELKQAISALQCAKRGHCDHAMADEAIAALEALTQRPAAQAEREAFESRVTLNSIIKQYRIKAEDAHWLRASLPTQPAAQDEREADEVFLPRRLAATQKLTQLGYRYDSAHGKWLPAPQQATPEPVGEPFGYFRALPFGWEQCGEHDDGAVALYDRPAPGVPEGFVLVPVEPDIDILRPFFNCLNSELDTAWGVAMRTAQEKLAAAQAKGVPEDVLAILDECRNALMECDRDGDYALIDRIDALAAAQAKGADK